VDNGEEPEGTAEETEADEPNWATDPIPEEITGVAGTTTLEIPAVADELPGMTGELPGVQDKLPGVAGELSGVQDELPGVGAQHEIPGVGDDPTYLTQQQANAGTDNEDDAQQQANADTDDEDEDDAPPPLQPRNDDEDSDNEDDETEGTNTHEETDDDDVEGHEIPDDEVYHPDTMTPSVQSTYGLRPRQARDYIHLHVNIVHPTMPQYSLNRGLRNFKVKGEQAAEKDLEQLHLKEKFAPVEVKDLTPTQKRLRSNPSCS
jgi:hypothetical protein